MSGDVRDRSDGRLEVGSRLLEHLDGFVCGPEDVVQKVLVSNLLPYPVTATFHSQIDDLAEYADGSMSWQKQVELGGNAKTGRRTYATRETIIRVPALPPERRPKTDITITVSTTAAIPPGPAEDAISVALEITLTE